AELSHPGLLAQLLDDVPVATIVSGSALIRSGLNPHRDNNARRLQVVDICAGWQADGVMAKRLEEPGGTGTLQPRSPLAGGLGAAAGRPDPLGWHDLADLPPTSMRRLRRVDVTAADDPATHTTPASASASRSASRYAVDAMFRDSYVEASGTEVVVHEYTVTATVDGGGTVVTASATPGVLPAPECPQAAGSAHRIAGLHLGELRSHVARQFVGVSTCTHLNDA
nr:DUF2889 domain-containing protein [Micromonospora sp. DSM 115978]